PAGRSKRTPRTASLQTLVGDLMALLSAVGAASWRSSIVRLVPADFKSWLAAVREVLEQVGARQHADRLAAARDDDRVRPAGQGREDLVERLARLDRREGRLHRL